MTRTNGDGMKHSNGDITVQANLDKIKQNISDTNNYIRITRLAREALDAQFSVLHVRDANWQWERYASGLKVPTDSDLPGGKYFRCFTIRKDSILVVPDAKRDDRFRENSWVTNDPQIRFYIGCPLYNRGGKKIGTLGVFDSSPREVVQSERRIMSDLKTLVHTELERKDLKETRLNLLEKLQKSRLRSRTDELTGLWNRRGLFNLIKSEINRSNRKNTSMTLAMIDLDDFKHVNDRYGHPAGDQVLRVVAQKLQENLRNYDIIGRYGGDEFLAVFPQSSHEEMKRIIRRIKTIIPKTDIEIENSTINISISTGLFTREGTDSLTTQEMIKHADDALYETETNGSNPIR